MVLHDSYKDEYATPPPRGSMHLLVAVLNAPETLDTILAGFVDLGVRGATVIHSEGMGRVLAHEIPIFAGLQTLINRSGFLPGSSGRWPWGTTRERRSRRSVTHPRFPTTGVRTKIAAKTARRGWLGLGTRISAS